MGDFHNPVDALEHANSVRVPETPDESSHGDDFLASQVPSPDGEMRHSFANDAGDIGNDRPKPLDVDYSEYEVDEPEHDDADWGEQYEYFDCEEDAEEEEQVHDPICEESPNEDTLEIDPNEDHPPEEHAQRRLPSRVCHEHDRPTTLERNNAEANSRDRHRHHAAAIPEGPDALPSSTSVDEVIEVQDDAGPTPLFERVPLRQSHGQFMESGIQRYVQRMFPDD